MAQWLDHWNFTFAQLRTPNKRVRVRDKAYFNFTISGGDVYKEVSILFLLTSYSRLKRICHPFLRFRAVLAIVT